MIDNFALALSHGLMMLAAWRLLTRPDLDKDDAVPLPRGGKMRFGRAKADPTKSERRPGA